ncbi:alpha/beta fold hydrolase [Streptomyces sp. NPDC102364]|uniref:alpha/beta fold hydrolase n=1 Tax=Streptomyces sp. NPDC102364 TaxID=3366161 RepID=UPI00381B1489
MEAPASFDHIVTSRDGTGVCVTVTGSGRPLVVVHGSMGAARDWQPLADRLAARFTVYAVDRRGHGRSGDGLSYDIAREHEDIEAVMELAGPEAVLFGHSYGGLIATGVALRRPPVALVLYDPGLTLNGPLGGPATAGIERAVAAGDHEGALVIGLREVLGMSHRQVAQFRAMPEWETFLDRISTWPRELRAVDAVQFTLDQLAVGLTSQCLIVTGEHSPGALATVARGLHAGLPGSEFAVIAGAGHDAHLEAPAELAHALVAFAG